MSPRVFYESLVSLFRLFRSRPSREVETTIELAAALAAGMGHGKLTVYHLVLALLETDKIPEVIRQSGGDAGALRAAATSALQEAPPATAWERFLHRIAPRYRLPADGGFDEAITMANVYVAVARKPDFEFTCAHLLIALISEESNGASKVLKSCGLTRLAVLRYICHGDAAIGVRVQPAAIPGPSVYITIENDDFTPMEFVIDVLEKIFEMDSGTAFATMWHVHRHGSQRLGPYEPARAATLAEEAMLLAQAMSHPLKITVGRG